LNLRPTSRLLLDVNVWIALLDDAHVHNTEALVLFPKPKLQIATCALVENRVLRVLNLPGYSQRGPAGFDAVRAKMALATFDHRIALNTVANAEKRHLVLL
jgi:predicted nucleic acid-binding protein